MLQGPIHWDLHEPWIYIIISVGMKAHLLKYIFCYFTLHFDAKYFFTYLLTLVTS